MAMIFGLSIRFGVGGVTRREQVMIAVAAARGHGAAPALAG